MIRTLTQRERTSDSFFDLENWQILKEEGKAVCRFGCPNCSAKLLQTAKLPNCQTEERELPTSFVPFFLLAQVSGSTVSHRN